MTDDERAGIGAGAARRPFDTLGPGARQPADPMDEAFAIIPRGGGAPTRAGLERSVKHVLNALLPENKHSANLAEGVEAQVRLVLKAVLPITTKSTVKAWIEAPQRVEDSRLIRDRRILYVQIAVAQEKKLIMRWIL